MSDTSNTQINVAQLLKSSVGTTREYDLEAQVPSLGRDARLLTPVVGRIHLTRLNDGILVQGHLHTEVELTCDRCLKLFAWTVEFDVEEQFVPTVDVITGKWLITEENDPALLIDDHHILDLEEILRQAIYLELPMHPVCREDCKGLCPKCGQDFNQGACDCSDDEIDPRWEVLKDLVKH